ncbi:MAG: hypothetical protein ACXVBW_15600, partial [Bdellovibrionota bacterium]
MRSNGWVYASVGAALIALLAVPFWLKHRSRPQARITDPSCLSAYQDLYHGNQLNVLVAFGYKDSRPARFVGDRYE